MTFSMCSCLKGGKVFVGYLAPSLDARTSYTTSLTDASGNGVFIAAESRRLATKVDAVSVESSSLTIEPASMDASFSYSWTSSSLAKLSLESAAAESAGSTTPMLGDRRRFTTASSSMSKADAALAVGVETMFFRAVQSSCTVASANRSSTLWPCLTQFLTGESYLVEYTIA